jgi:hypothetical protein
MTDEASSLLRIGAFGFVAAIVYGFLTKEFLGTWGLIGLSLGPGYAGLLLFFEERRRGEQASRREAFLRFAGLPPPDPITDEPLEAEDMAVIPTPSLWPFLLSIGSAVLLTGLIFGAWLVVLGLVVLVWGIWGWVSAANRETVAARRARERASEPAGEPAHRPSGAVRAPRPPH